MNILQIFVISSWLVSAWTTALSKDLIELFKCRKDGRPISSVDQLITKAMEDINLFRMIIKKREKRIGTKCFINAFILNRASFIDKLVITEIEELFNNLNYKRLFRALPRLLDSPKMRAQALKFFTRHPKYSQGSIHNDMMLLLLFCNCKKAHCRLTKESLQHIIENIKESAEKFESLVASLIIHDRDYGI